LSKSRIETRFAALKVEGRAAFVPYVMAGDPDAATALAILKGLRSRTEERNATAGTNGAAADA